MIARWPEFVVERDGRYFLARHLVARVREWLGDPPPAGA